MTDRAEHTAGPWVIPDISWEPWEGAIEVRSKDDDVICYTSSVHGREKFDARLIAAAPDLLTALAACQKALAMMIEPKSISATSPQCAWAAAVEAETKARTAISRATGEA